MRVFGAAGLSCLIALLAACSGSNPALTPPSAVLSTNNIVTTGSGTVQGTLASNVRIFQGIPYAAAPTGALRFKAPQPRAPWTGTLMATTPGAICPQSGRGGVGGQTTTEDCLFLNIWTPYPVTRANTPVMMFIHGGGFSGGGGSQYDGSWLAGNGGIIVVTINYRLGILGYLANANLDDGNGDTGNYGLEDQQFAMKWIKTNIAAFGGDPNNVTIAGESAGAMSVCNNLASPQAAGLFTKAIVESGPCSFNWQSLQTAESEDATIPGTLGCNGTKAQVVACLRSPTLTPATILTAQAAVPPSSSTTCSNCTALFPSSGGYDFPNEPRTALGKVPLLLGANNLELGIGNAISRAPTTQSAFDSAVSAIYGGNATAVENTYNPTGSGGYPLAYVQLTTDFDPTAGATEIVFCMSVRAWELDQAAGGAPIYGYEFNDPNAPSSSGGTPEGPVHTSELQYLFPNASGGAGMSPSLPAASQTLSNTMVQYWANFVKTGNPNATGLPAWPAYSSNTTVQQLVPSAVQSGLDVNVEHNCSFWQSFGYSELQ